MIFFSSLIYLFLQGKSSVHIKHTWERNEAAEWNSKIFFLYQVNQIDIAAANVVLKKFCANFKFLSNKKLSCFLSKNYKKPPLGQIFTNIKILKPILPPQFIDHLSLLQNKPEKKLKFERFLSCIKLTSIFDLFKLSWRHKFKTTNRV